MEKDKWKKTKEILWDSHWHTVTDFESGHKVSKNSALTFWMKQTKTSIFNLNIELHERKKSKNKNTTAYTKSWHFHEL